MRANRRGPWVVWGTGLLIGVLAAGVSTLPAPAGARNPCIEPGNLTQNCGFDQFVEHIEGDKRLQVPAGWGYFILAGSMDFRPSEDTYWGAPSLWLLSDGVPFRGGIYQQVRVTPGVVYQSDAGWAAVTKPNFERRLGLDPTGGTDPLAPTVVWGPATWGLNSWPDLTVSTRATGPTMTVFVWVDHPTTYGNDWIFIDAVGLWPDPSQPAATLTPTPSPQPTRRPPTRTPQPVPATETPTQPPALPTDTATPTFTATVPPTPTQTPIPSATSTWTVTPSPAPPTATPPASRTPLPTIVQEAMLVAASTGESDVGSARPVTQGVAPDMALLYIAAAALLMGIVLCGMGVWLWRRGRRTADEPTRDEPEG